MEKRRNKKRIYSRSKSKITLEKELEKRLKNILVEKENTGNISVETCMNYLLLKRKSFHNAFNE